MRQRLRFILTWLRVLRSEIRTGGITGASAEAVSAGIDVLLEMDTKDELIFEGVERGAEPAIE